MATILESANLQLPCRISSAYPRLSGLGCVIFHLINKRNPRERALHAHRRCDSYSLVQNREKSDDREYLDGREPSPRLPYPVYGPIGRHCKRWICIAPLHYQDQDTKSVRSWRCYCRPPHSAFGAHKYLGLVERGQIVGFPSSSQGSIRLLN